MFAQNTEINCGGVTYNFDCKTLFGIKKPLGFKDSKKGSRNIYFNSYQTGFSLSVVL